MNVQRMEGLQPAAEHGNRPTPRPAEHSADGASFQQLLRAQAARAASVRFSNHAQERMQSNGLSMDGNSLARLELAVDAAGEKGAKDALVLMDDLALLVSITNRTVITTVDPARRKNGVFTNIDSVVMA